MGLSVALVAALGLAACGDDKKDEAKKEEAPVEQTQTAEDVKVDEKAELTAEDAVAKLEEPTEDTVCAVCGMKVYVKEHEMGAFSAQAVKEDGTNEFYDDIGCLLNAELMNEEDNYKFVRDFNSKEWVLVDEATIVKTELKSPMNWGYIFFAEKADAEKYMAENEGTSLAELDAVKAEAKERYEKKKAKQAEGGEEGHDMHGHEGHDHGDSEEGHDMHGEHEGEKTDEHAHH